MAVLDPTQLAAFLQAERDIESGNSYTAYNSSGGASGAYQFIQSTWTSEALAAGYPQYASEPASAAPPAVQDAVAGTMAQGYYDQFGNWKDTAEAWYYPAWAGNPSYQNSVPYPSAGNTLTIGQYGDKVTSKMNSILGGSSASSGKNTTTSSPGFLKSFDTALNPNFGSNPFTDTSHAINMAIVRGALVMVGLLMIAAGLSIIVLGSINILSVGKKTSAIATGAKAAVL